MWTNFIHSDFSDREKVREHQLHKSKLNHIKPRIDNKPPRNLMHLKQNSKKKLKKKERLNEISNQNKILLAKLMKISNFSKTADPRAGSRQGNYQKSQAERKIAVENTGILKRIKSTKSHYSFAQHTKDYRRQQYYMQMLSENARRIPRTTDFANPSEFASRSSRPTSAIMYNKLT